MKVLSFGELLWDMIGGKAYIGGAPFNVACHLAKMGIYSAYISSVGKDDLGKEAIKTAKDNGLDPSYISIHPYLPTGKVDVYLSHQGHPEYTIHENTAWDEIILKEDLKKGILEENWNAFCFGTIAQRTASNRILLYDLISHLHYQQLFYDINLRQNFYQKEWIEHSLQMSTMLKLNADEAITLSKLLLGKVLNREDFCQSLFSKYSLKIICITLGEQGSIVYNGQNCFHIPCVKVKVVDTVGAGDSYSAAFLYSFLSGASPEESGLFASQLGAFVASQSGAIPEYSSELKEKINDFKNQQEKIS